MVFSDVNLLKNVIHADQRHRIRQPSHKEESVMKTTKSGPGTREHIIGSDTDTEFVTVQKIGKSTLTKRNKLVLLSLMLIILVLISAGCGIIEGAVASVQQTAEQSVSELTDAATVAIAGVTEAAEGAVADAANEAISDAKGAVADAVAEAAASVSNQITAIPALDRAGNPITVPTEVTTIVSLAPSITETLIALGLTDKIVAIDTFSSQLAGVNPDWPAFDMMAPDIEQLLALNPDILLASNISAGGGEDPFKQLSDAGISVIYIPTSDSIEGIVEDVVFIGAVTGTAPKALELVSKMQAEIEEIAAIGRTVGASDRKSVLFEISASPHIYSFGSGVFLNEMLQLIGAENVFSSQTGWLPVSDEAALAANPDVILTNVNYLPDPVAEIKGRSGWEVVNAVKNGRVYLIDNFSSSLPNHNIVKALRQMALSVYPDLFR